LVWTEVVQVTFCTAYEKAALLPWWWKLCYGGRRWVCRRV